jgi:hypothetical protein
MIHNAAILLLGAHRCTEAPKMLRETFGSGGVIWQTEAKIFLHSQRCLRETIGIGGVMGQTEAKIFLPRLQAEDIGYVILGDD